MRSRDRITPYKMSSSTPWRSQLCVWIKVIVLMGTLLILWLAYAWLQIESEKAIEPQNTADVGIVLGAALWNDRPSPGLAERLDQAIGNYEAGKFHYFIVSGGLDAAAARLTEAEGMALYLTSHGIPEHAIIEENRATDTYENLLYSKRIMQQHDWNSAIIVTHDYHGRRALEMAQSLGYHTPELSLIQSTVLNEPYNKGREVLAYTKWKLQQLLMSMSAHRA